MSEAAVRTHRRSVAERVAALPWTEIETQLAANGFATTGALLDADECAGLIATYAGSARFRSRIDMERYGFGRGEYQYFAYPLPEVVAALRTTLYAALAPVANRWMSALAAEIRYPAAHADYLAHCHARGQSRPTPLLLRYGPGDYNCLHQDLYGDEHFPLQATLLLSDPQRDFAGGEFVLATQRPRRQSRVDVVPLARGEAVVFGVRERPAAGPRGVCKATMRHGVSRLHGGSRYTLGIVFHDAA